MPYQSRAQQRLFHHLVSQGKLAPEVAEEYDEASKGKKIPQYVKRKAFGGEVYAESGSRCPACDYPLDDKPLAVDAGEACPRCGFGSAKDVPRKAQGGEIMDPSMYRARGGEVCSHCGGSVGFGVEDAQPIMKELYTGRSRGSIDDGKIGGSFAKALKNRRR
jgi:hypothetical protein